MRYLKLLCLIFLFLSACKKAPEYPTVPEIEFAGLQRYVVTNPFTLSPSDSINIEISFKDGDGDLGLSDNDNQSPYNPFDFVFDNTGELIRIGTIDTLPSFNFCNYVIGEYIEDNPGKDTVYVQHNPNHFNFFAELYIYNGVRFEKYDPEVCPSPFYGRFPELNPGNYDGPIDGSLTFVISDEPSFPILFEGLRAKFKIYIKDRALHTSNVIETSEFTFTY